MDEDAWNFTDRAEAILPKDVSSGLDAPIMDEESERNLQAAYLKQKEEEKKIYLEMARRRDEIMALLRRQRAERIKKEMISQPYKPNQDNVNKRPPPLKHAEDMEQDVEAVRGWTNESGDAVDHNAGPRGNNSGACDSARVFEESKKI